MCTVSFVPAGDKFFFTSNRDEKLSRKKALAPAVYDFEGVKFLFPKDTDAGGTWIAAKENGDVAILLNGAFTNHIAVPPYRKSRGIILLDIFSGEKPSAIFSGIELENIEPFTIVLFENKSLFEFRWNGIEKFAKQLPKQQAYIWSSATLYDDDIILKRENWFTEFLNKPVVPSQSTIINFHRFTGDGDGNSDLLMNRDGLHKTVSITSIEVNNIKTIMQYLDLEDNEISLHEVFFHTEMTQAEKEE